MVAPTTPPADAADAADAADDAIVGDNGFFTLPRFSQAERLVHWSTAVLTLVLVVTAACLYIDTLSVLVGRRSLLKDAHVVAGLLFPVPLFAAYLAGPAGASVRRDARRLARFDDADVRWLRGAGRPERHEGHGKFHPGQKLNASFTLGVMVVMLATGAIMRWFGAFPLSWRTGATFVHDWLSVFFVLVLFGHIAKAMRDPEARRGMRRGRVDARWARVHHPRWADDELPVPPQP